EITTDGGRTWVDAHLQEPRFPIAFTRFRLPWRFDGREAQIASRATDETGYIQPSREALIAARGTNSGYHFHAVKSCNALADGTITTVELQNRHSCLRWFYLRCVMRHISAGAIQMRRRPTGVL